MAVEWRPLSPALGIEVVGLDLRELPERPELDELQAQLAAAWRQHHLILVRGQQLDLGQQARFASWFGPINTRGYAFGADPAHPEMYIANTRAGGVAREGSLLKHQDHCFFERPLPGICLYAEEVPRVGGDTIFVNAHLAYERLPAQLKARLAGLEAIHVYDYANDYGTQRFRIARSPQAPTAVHPVVWGHPETGRPILFVNELMTDAVLGLPPEESEALLATLWSQLDDPAIRYQHRWRPGDLVVWDNRSLQHGRTDFPPGERRCLRRLQIG